MLIRKLKWLLPALLTVLLLAGCACAEEEPTIVDSGACTETLFWRLDSDNVLTIYGTGVMPDYKSYEAAGMEDRSYPPWNAYRNQYKAIVLEPGITVVGESAFTCRGCLTVVIPETLQEIRTGAFNCQDVEHVYAVSDVHWANMIFGSYGSNPLTVKSTLYFDGVPATSFAFPEGTTVIDAYVLANCLNQMDVTIPEGVTKISNHAFSKSNVTSVTIPESLTELGRYAFNECDELKSVALPGALKEIPENAFYSCDSLESVTLGDGIAVIGDYAFARCGKLQEIHMPDSVETIGRNAFHYCTGMTRIRVSESVTVIPESAFATCTSLQEINVPKNTTSIGTYAFADCFKVKELKIPDTVETISSRAFHQCWALESLVIPAGAEIQGLKLDTCTSLRWLEFRSRDLPWETGPVMGDIDPVIICYEFSEIDFWALDNGYSTRYLDNWDGQGPIVLRLPEEYELPIGNRAQLEPELYPPQESPVIEWHSSAPHIVSVEDGELLGRRVGEATITATCGNVSDSMTVSTYAALTSFALSQRELWLFIDETAQLSIVNALPPNATVTYTWSSDNEGVATVDQTGLVTAQGLGDCVILVMTNNGLGHICRVHVVELQSFELTGTEIWLTSKHQAQLSIVNKVPAGAINTFAWSSTDPDILSVDQNGLVSGRMIGDASVIVEADNGLTRECIVHVIYPVTSVAFDRSSAVLLAGEAAQLNVRAAAAGGEYGVEAVTLRSLDESVATVSPDGTVTAVGRGSAVIVAESQTGVQAQCLILVLDEDGATLPDGLVQIDEEAFAGTDVARFILPDGCRRICARAFADSAALSSIYMPDSVTEIAVDAFSGSVNVTFECESENAAAAFAQANGIPCLIG